jgi:hypothetical protein
MCKNIVLKSAINTALALPRHALWATAAVVVTFSADAGLSVIGDHLGMVAGTAIVSAAEGSFLNASTGDIALTLPTGEIIVRDGANAAGGDISGTSGEVIYATEVFATGNPTIPSEDGAYQAAEYKVSGDILKEFNLVFSVSGGASISEITGLVDGATCDVEIKGTTTKVDAASCSINDGSSIEIAYKLAGVATTLKTAGGKIEMTAKLTGTSPAVALNPTRTLTVASSTQAGKVEILPEMGKLGYVFVSVADDSKLFVDKSPVGEGGDTPFVSDELVKIGYVRITSQDAADLTGRTLFTLGGKSGDKAALTITNGQFSASPGGINAIGVAYIDAGGKIEALSPIEDSGATAKWALSNSHLTAIINKSAEKDANNALVNPKGAPIMIKVDRLNAINDINVEVGGGPSAEIVVTPDGQTTGTTVGPVELRRIPRDGVTCWVYNVPPPAGNLDLLSVRISNETARAGTLVGTLYPQDGGDTPDFMSVNLLTKIAANASDTRNELIEMVTNSSGVTEPGLKGGATIRLSAKDIADAGGVDWTEGRKVLKVSSQISELELLTLLRYGTASAEQAQSNLSTGVTGNSCE